MGVISERFLCPLVLLNNLLFFFRSEVVLDVEELADLLHALALNERGDFCAREFKKRLDVEIVGGHDDFKEHLLVHVDEVCVPLVDHLR